MANKKTIFIILLSVFLNYVQKAQVNCSLISSPASASIICGQSVQLSASGAGGAILMNNNFNSGTAGTGWSASAAAQFNNPCGPSPDGTIHMWMGNTTAAPRTMTTIGYNIGCTGTICFDLKFASTFTSPCEEPDLSTEGVDIQYSTDGGATWTSINYFDPLTGLYDAWANYCFAIPAGAVSPNTMFRWLQTGSSGNDYDHWGIDNVNITLTGPCATPAPYYYSWVPATGLSATNISNPVASPLTSTTYTLYFTNGIDDTCTAVIPVNVTRPTADAGNMQTICSGQSANLVGTGNTFLAGVQTFNSTTTTAIADNATVNNAITVSGLPYATITTTSIAQVCMNITHTFDGDLDIFLRCPSGILYELTTDNGGGGDNYTNTCFTASAVTNVTAGTAPFTGNFIPEGAGGLGALNGCNANGNWTLRVTDDAGGDVGTINSWNISFVVPPPMTVSWSPTAGMTGSSTLTPTVTPAATTQYTLTVTGSPGCSTSDTVTVQVVTPSPITVNSPAPICSGSSATLTATPLIAGAVYNWSPGGLTGQSITVSPTLTTVYSCSYTLGGCTSAAATGTVTVINASNISVNSPTICVGGSTTLNASGATTYTWSPATGLSATTGASVTANPTVTTIYTIIETTSGCNGTTTATVTVNNSPVINAGIDDTLCAGSSTTLTASGGVSYVWTADPSLSTPGSASTTATPTTTTVYTVTGTAGNGCSSTDNVTVVVYPIPVAPTFTTPAFICPGDPTTLTASPSVAGAIYTWQPGNLTGQSIVVNPMVTTVYTVTYEVNGCTSSPTSGTVTVNNAAIISVPPAAICIGGSTTLNATGATTYTWSPATGLSATTGSSVTANPTITTVYTIVETSSGCNGSTTTTVTVNNLPVIDAGIDDTLCDGSSTTLNASGGVSYVWTADPTLSGTVTATPTATPTTTTIYTVTGTDGNGCQNTDNVTVVVYPIPVAPTFTTPAFICPGAPTTLTASPSVAGAIYTWQPGNLTGQSVVVNPMVTTVYTSTYEVNGCTSPPTSGTVTVNNAAIISVPPAAICIGGSTTLNASGATTYTWSPATGLSTTSGSSVTANPIVTTVYTIVETSSGCNGSTTTTVTVNGLPSVDAGVSDTVCLGSFTSLSATGALSFVWTADPTLSGTSTATPTATPTVTTIYTVTGTDGNGCQNTDSVTIVVPPSFTVTLTPAPASCFASCDGSINLTVNPATSPFSPYSFIWSNGATTQNASSLCAGNYGVTVSNISTCAQTASATITQPTSVIVTQTNNTPVTCNGGSDGSLAVTASGGTPGYVYSFDGAAFTPITSASGLTAGTHVVGARDANGCTSSIISLTIAEPQVVHIDPPAINSMTVCVGQSAVLSASAAGGNGGYMYTWNDGINPPVTSSSAVTVTPVTSPVNYTVTAVDVTGCASDNQEVITVSLNTPLIMHAIVPSSDKICETKNIVVNVSGEGGNNILNFTWAPMTGVTILIPDGSSARLSPPSTTVYTVTIHDACSSPTDTVHYTLVVNPTPTLSITPAVTSGCAPLAVQFTGTSTPASATCSWNFGGNGSSTSCSNTASTFALPGDYTITYAVTDVNGCQNTKTSLVSVFPIPQAIFAASPQPTTIIDPVITFTDITDANIAGHTWIFNDSIGTSSILEVAAYTFAQAGTYPVTLAVVTDKGCVDTVTQNVYITDEFVVYVPNSFTPDGDDINEEFLPTGTGITGLEMTIFDRWGGEIFNTAELGKGWNGRSSSDKRVEKGVYIYKLVVTNFLGEKKLITGHVTLVR